LVTDLSAAAIDPVSDLQVIDNEKLKSIAEHGSEKLEKMIKKASE
jgi:ribosome-binding ATPase YchF (GTP1/OBG family)